MNTERKVRVNPKSIEALIAGHKGRRKRTEILLFGALERMASGKTNLIKPGFKWTRTSLAEESGIHINTLLRKGNGTNIYNYQAALDKLDSYKSRRNKEKVDQVQVRVAALRKQLDEVIAQRDQALKAIKTVEWELIKERELKLSAIHDKEYVLQNPGSVPVHP